NYTGTDVLDVASFRYLKRVWPRLKPANPGQVVINWANRNPPVYSPQELQQGFVLEGDQCLVFFLGGMQQAPTPGQPGTGGSPGSSATRAAPSARAAATPTPPFYNFESARLVQLPHGGFGTLPDPNNPSLNLFTAAVGNNVFLSYVDHFSAGRV